MSTTATKPFTCWKNPQHTDILTTAFGWPQCGTCKSAPQYHERVQYAAAAGVNLTVYVPAPRARWAAVLAPRSAVVGLPAAGERVIVYYEGWVHGACQYVDRDVHGQWEAGVEHAAGRQVTAYPTRAQANAPAAELVPVGVYDVATRSIAVTDPVALDRWLAQ